ncbi:MAG: ROK family transcriptional regulator [Treponema sp.]|nr:ROK family transcriptional regulator [Treponema sp.]
MDKFRLAQINKYNVIRCLIRESPINRAIIAKRTELSIPTVMSIVNTLCEKGFIRSIGKGKSSGGKPPEMLEIVADRLFYIGVDIGRTTIRIVANDAMSRQIACLREPTGKTIPERAFVERLSRLIIKFTSSIHAEKSRIMGVGVAMPGLIENGTGKVLFSPDFEWVNVPLKVWLEKLLPFYLLVENANRVLALNESVSAKMDEPLYTTFAVNLGYGIGGALVIGEDLYKGASGSSGEIGHFIINREGPLCKCGNRGCLESLSSGAAIALQAQEAVRKGIPTKIAGLAGKESAIDAACVFRAANLGDKTALKIIGRAAENIGIGLSMAINLLDPDRLILCGGLMKNGPLFFEKIKTSIGKHTMWQAGREVVISIGIKGEYSTANGACRVLADKLWENRNLPI